MSERTRTAWLIAAAVGYIAFMGGVAIAAALVASTARCVG